MISYTVKTSGGEYSAKFVRFRDIDPRYAGRGTVTLLLDLPYSTVKDLFSTPGEWSVTKHFTTDIPNAEHDPDIVADCADYSVLCCISDCQDGVLEVVVGKMTDSEILEELRGVLET